VYTITSDGRSLFTARRKERLLMERKVKPASVRWTVPCREKLGKQSKYTEVREKLVTFEKPKLTVSFKKPGVPNRLFVSKPRESQDRN
jgi:ribosomal protein L24E